MALYSRFLATYHSMSGLPSGPQGGPLDPNIRPRNQVAANDPMFLHCSRDWKQQFAARYRLFDSASYGLPASDASQFAAIAPPIPYYKFTGKELDLPRHVRHIGCGRVRVRTKSPSLVVTMCLTQYL
jgi:hypothetical protein